MITRIQALNYRCLRYVDVALDRFHVLVGAPWPLTPSTMPYRRLMHRRFL